MRISPTNLLTSGFQIVITIALGAFMIINAAVIGFKVMDGYDNYQAVQRLDVVATGRLHVFNSRDFTYSPQGVQRKCEALQNYSTNEIVVRDTTVAVADVVVAPKSNFCNDLFVKNIAHWQKYAPAEDGMGFASRLFWSIVLGLVIMSGAYLVASIPATLLSLAIPGLMTWARVITVIFTIPVIAFSFFFLVSVWTTKGTYWNPPGYASVDTTEVFITKDGSLYKAPETFYDWTDSTTGNKLTERSY